MTDNIDTIHIIATGGTIDKKYDPISQINQLNEKSIIPDYLTPILGADTPFHFTSLFALDSREMESAHRDKIIDTIQKSNSKKIILLHGTDTMVETAQYIEGKITPLNKSVIITGAIIPLNGFIYSDAPFNLGYAIAHAQTQSSGIYICMNGKIANADKIHKNLETAYFETK